ncbi:DEAD/DEAH box helicase [Kitasatospora cystarginea]|uniref:DEAD/DEAH box helicase n=1 Tax=Kitasatospora cystarginea TaxID=58350 RepID=A0ABN3EWD6_9ACTN
MRPTLEARALKESLLQYLSTTYALSDEGAREALHRFLGDESSGMFRGPYLRIRTPFIPADPSWRSLLEWAPEGWSPYAHQAEAFARLTSFGHEPQPTLVTTGTGSGKTESFLLPILDHCRRERAAGNAGVKAVLLYPMNALATDQADRINKYLKRNDELSAVRAGLYIGDKASTRYERVLTNRSDIQLTPPDILITNYRMLDLLLQRRADAAMWRDSQIRYVVVDEFHTYDGAQGTDVAMLLRRLASAVGVSEQGRPLGSICPVATSATLASGTGGDGKRDLLRVATQVFGTQFSDGAVIGERRESPAEFIDPGQLDNRLPLPSPEELAALPDPALGEEALSDLVFAVTNSRNMDPFVLGATLKRHILTQAVMQSLGSGVKTSDEVLDVMWRSGAYSWGQAVATRPEQAADALARFVALLSIARDPESTPEEPRPLVHVEVHQWARSVSRLLRGVLPWPKAEFRWDSADASDASGVDAQRSAPATTATAGVSANVFLPAVYCRECGRSGWAVFTPESDDLQADFNASTIRRASVGQDKIRVRNLIAATDEEAREGSGAAPMPASTRTGGAGGRGRLHGSSGRVMVLDGVNGRLRLPDPIKDFDPITHEPNLTARDSAFVLVNLGETANTAAGEDWCPMCGEHNAIRFLGTGGAALAAASITRLFTGGELAEEPRDRKTLMFSDSVQDAAHRAGFVASRSYTFSLRALLADRLSEKKPTALNDLVADLVAATTDPVTGKPNAEVLSAVVPPDLHDHQGVARLLSGKANRGGDLKTWRLIGERLAFQTLMEFGFRSRQGRTLELTRTAAAHVRIPNVDIAVDLVRSAHLEPTNRGPEPIEQDDARYLGFLRVFLERLRSRGAVRHRWLEGYLHEAGTSRFFVLGRRPPGMPAFPKRVAAPRFLLGSVKEGSEFDPATGRLAWYERWAQRCLELQREMAPEFWSRLLPQLHEAGLLSMRIGRDGTTRIYGLAPGGIDVLKLTDDQVNLAYVRCKVCAWEQTVHPSLLDQWHGQRCPSYRCGQGRLVAGDRAEKLGTHLRDRDYQHDYYRRLYLKSGPYQVITAEHTALLDRPDREAVEKAFRERTGFNDPNVLSATPTLELGIDIGDLSAVVLASLPRNPANYAQRVGRAGRRDGNAFLLTIPERRRRDLYFLEKPMDMIDGQIVPPGCHLSAVEILRRQYMAHLLDLAAAGRLLREDGTALAPLPHSVSALFGPSGYLDDLMEVALAQSEQLVKGFLELFPDLDGLDTGVTEEAAEQLQLFAASGLRSAIEAAGRAWQEQGDLLRRRLRAIDEAIRELHEADPEEARQKAELEAERRGIGGRLRILGETHAQGALCDLGLLPNYALIDTRTQLDATLYWAGSEDQATGKTVYKSTQRTYERPRRLAIRELAPGNTFYVNGYRHEITGLEIGTPERRSWQEWRVCPNCGYVRTDNARNDRDPCPRCHTTQIADDGSCLFNVVQPTLVTSRDRREDAKIRDDRDDREPGFYEVYHAVDMPAEVIERGSWRHASATFGVDFSRRAVIRTFNLGPTRYDTPARDDFAGHTVRLNPFHVCTGCGAASAGGRPVFDHHTDSLSSSAARDPRLKHHRPWCPLRRGKKDDADQIRILLAHELTTDALRILLPAGTVLVDEKVHSLRAALRLGVDRHYGGDPQHLDSALVSEPDGKSGARRWSMVLFDTLPGGTGYLHRLADPDAFRATLAAARKALLECPCREEESRNACHRCLYRYTREQYQQHVSRAMALKLIADLLGPVDEDGIEQENSWIISEVATTGQIGLDGLVESDLEARFLIALRQWASDSSDAVLEEDGLASGHLKITTEAGSVKWRLTAQERLVGTRTDFTLTREDGPRESLKVYLDGRRFHSSEDHNEAASDAAKRAVLGADGQIVFQITAHDVDLFEGRSTKAARVWPPYGGDAPDTAKNAYEQYGGNRASFTDLVFTNPIDTLLAYLRDPDRDSWARRARALVTGLTAAPGTTALAQADRRDELVAALRNGLAACVPGQAAPASEQQPGARTVGPIHIFRATDATGLPLLFTVDASNPEALAWSVLAVLDDTAGGLDTIEHRQRWRSWLYWANLVQFLAHSGGDGIQLTASQVSHFDVETLAVCSAATARPAEPATQPSTADDRANASPKDQAEIVRDPAWDEDILPLLDEDEDTNLRALALALASRGKQAPVFGYELGNSRWPADFAWDSPEAKIAVVPDRDKDPDQEHDQDQDVDRRDAAYTAAGWTVRAAGEWLDHLDSLTMLLPNTATEPGDNHVEGPTR